MFLRTRKGGDSGGGAVLAVAKVGPAKNMFVAVKGSGNNGFAAQAVFIQQGGDDGRGAVFGAAGTGAVVFPDTIKRAVPEKENMGDFFIFGVGKTLVNKSDLRVGNEIGVAGDINTDEAGVFVIKGVGEKSGG